MFTSCALSVFGHDSAARGTSYKTITTELNITTEIQFNNGALFLWGFISYIKLGGFFHWGVYLLESSNRHGQ